MKSWNVPMIAVVALLVVSPEANAADSRMVLRGGAGWISTTGEWTGDLLMTEGVSVTKLEADSTIGPQLSLEYSFTHLIGGEVSVLQGSHEIAAAIDLYLGPVIGWVIWGDLKPSAVAQQEVAIGAIKMHDDFAWGINVGVDVPFARHWAFNFDLRDLDYSARTDSRPIKAVLGEDAKIPIKPLIATAGFGLRW